MTRGKAGRSAPIASAVVLAAGLATSAAAQVDTKSKAPIDITANQAEVINSKCVTIWRGSAEALQGTSRLRAETISVFAHPKGTGADGQPSCGGADRIVADGQVYYVTPQQIAHGDHAVYSQAADQIVITGHVVVVQGADVARGDRLTIKVSTREAKMEANVSGPGRAGRVRGVFYPDQGGESAGSAKP